MKINDKRPLNVWKFKDLFPGDVFEFKEKIYIKISNNNNLATENENENDNAFNLTQNKATRFDEDVIVTKLYCELNIKG